MKRRLLVGLLIMCTTSVVHAQQTARTAVEANTKKFIEAFNKGDAAAVSKLYTVDARLLPPNSEMVQGRANIQTFWQGAITAGLKMVSLETAHVDAQGNIAVEVGRYVTTIPNAGGATTTDNGKYVVVWKRQGRNWLLAVDIFNSNMPGRP